MKFIISSQRSNVYVSGGVKPYSCTASNKRGKTSVSNFTGTYWRFGLYVDHCDDYYHADCTAAAGNKASDTYSSGSCGDS